VRDSGLLAHVHALFVQEARLVLLDVGRGYLRFVTRARVGNAETLSVQQAGLILGDVLHTITNPNNAAALTGVGFTDALPAGLVVATPNGLTGSCGGGTFTAPAGSNSVTLSGATLAASASCTVQINVVGTVAGNHTNSVTPMSTEAGAGSPASASLAVISTAGRQVGVLQGWTLALLGLLLAAATALTRRRDKR
jgi:hypothetical protein